MKRIILAFLLISLTALSSLSASAGITLSSGDIMMAVNYANTPLYASYNMRDNTTITYIPYGDTVMYIASVDRGFCVAYENFLGYVDEYNVIKVSSDYGFPLPDGSAYKNIIMNGSYNPMPSPTPTPSPTRNPYPSYQSVPAFSYRAKYMIPNQDISTRSGPGTKYAGTGTYPESYDYVVYYQTKGGSVNWGYVEFTYNNQKYRLYTGVKRFSTISYLDYCDEPYTYVTISRTHHPYYGPGYDYAQSNLEGVSAGETVKAFFTENGWALIEYSLTNGTLHRGWAPQGFWY